MLSCRSRKRHRWLYHFYRWQLQSSLRSTADAAPFWAPTRLSLCILQICPVPLQPSVNLLCIWRRADSFPSYSALRFAHALHFPTVLHYLCTCRFVPQLFCTTPCACRFITLFVLRIVQRSSAILRTQIILLVTHAHSRGVTHP